jgi:predicted DNA-binding ribbon-helix-helix protein
MITKSTNMKTQMEQTINIVVEKTLYTTIHEIAESEGLPLSILIRDLLNEALELREDVLLAQFAKNREKTFDNSKALSHEEVW